MLPATDLIRIWTNIHVPFYFHFQSENNCLVELVKMLVRDEDNDKGHVQKSKVLLFSHTIVRLSLM